MKKKQILWGAGWSGFVVISACNSSVLEPISGGPGAGSGGQMASDAGRSGSGVGVDPLLSGGPSDGSPTAGGSAGGQVRGDAGQGGSGPASCDAQRRAGASALKSHTACTLDSDCTTYPARCLAAESSNCGALFGVSKSATPKLDSVISDLDACTGVNCNSGGSCGLGAIDQCVSGHCVSPGQVGLDYCGSIAARIAQQTQGNDECTAVVRVDSQSLAILGQSYVCGAVAPVDEAGARAAVEATGAAWSNVVGSLASDAQPSAAWVFRATVGDFGTTSAVSVRTGQVVFVGNYDYSCTLNHVCQHAGPVRSDLQQWDSADLGDGCSLAPQLPFMSVDLAEFPDDPPMRAAEVLAVVLATALPAGLAHLGSLLDAVVVRQPIGPLAETFQTEHIVLLNAGKSH